MTPADLRAARKHLGLTQKALAKALRMGTHGWQSISKWERDGGTVPGPVQVAVELLASVDTHAKRGDSTQIEAPSPMGGTVPEGQTPTRSRQSNKPGREM